MSVYRRIPDAAPSDAEGRSLTQRRHSPLYGVGTKVPFNLMIDFDLRMQLNFSRK
jgi:hypothetical protein